MRNRQATATIDQLIEECGWGWHNDRLLCTDCFDTANQEDA